MAPVDTELAARAVSVVKVFGEGPNRVDALRGVDLELPAGEFSAIMGPSGSGKSTLGTFVLPVGQLSAAVLLAVLAGLLAAILPARAAARLDVLRAVTVE